MPADVRIRVEGLRELTGTLRRLSRELPKELREIHLRAAEPVARRAKATGPRRSGRLVGTVRALASQRDARVVVGRASVPYTRPIYWGWPKRNIAPNRFVDRAADDLASRVGRQYEKEVDVFVRRVWAQWR